jgi:methylaspartate mutase epsilon subunit
MTEVQRRTGATGWPEVATQHSFGSFISRMQSAGKLVVQPRMGMSQPAEMRAGLLATKQAGSSTVGTITLDSYTRVGNHDAARSALRDRVALNGYPVVAHSAATTKAVIEGIRSADFPIQVRHGSADPTDIFDAIALAGLDATEGGPISYCLPYSRSPVRSSVRSWAECSKKFASLREVGAQPHLETFGGCMLGQLCPPSLLVAISILEALFFRHCGLRSISLSYAQQTHPDQDAEAIHALRTLAGQLLPDVDWHVVVYAYMGVYPSTQAGAGRLLEAAARLAVRAGASRLIVKTAAEAHRIPTVEENVTALTIAADAAAGSDYQPHSGAESEVGAEARAIIGAVLELHADPGRALVRAFELGYLDVPYCLHPDNLGRTRSVIDRDGRLRWSNRGRLPIPQGAGLVTAQEMTSAALGSALSYVSRKFDAAGLEPARLPPIVQHPGRVNPGIRKAEWSQ